MVKGLISADNQFNGRFNPIERERERVQAITSRYYKMGRTDP